MLHFFFSSRRRHTRFKCDWSSDVCSSDLALTATRVQAFPVAAAPVHHAIGLVDAQRQSSDPFPAGPDGRCARMVFPRPRVRAREIGRASCRESWCKLAAELAVKGMIE